MSFVSFGTGRTGQFLPGPWADHSAPGRTMMTPVARLYPHLPWAVELELRRREFHPASADARIVSFVTGQSLGAEVQTTQPAPPVPSGAAGKVQFTDLTQLPAPAGACAPVGGEWVNAAPPAGAGSEAPGTVDSGSAGTPAVVTWSGVERRRPGRVEYANPELIALMRLQFRTALPEPGGPNPAAGHAPAGNDLPRAADDQALPPSTLVTIPR
jgi:hypothetical protein